MFGFKKKKQLSEHEREVLRRQKDHDFWMNGLQYLWLKDQQECLTIRGRDIECCWIDIHKNFKIRTRSGKEFSLKYEDWLKARFEDPNYKCVK